MANPSLRLETTMPSKLTKSQYLLRTKTYTENGEKYRATVTIRHDDKYGNGHNTFSITADVYREAKNHRWVEDSFGRLHDLVTRLWPDLEPYIKWHLCSTDGPMHYLPNTLYLAGDKDHWGKRKGEPLHTTLAIYVGNSPIAQKPGNKQFRQWLRNEYEKGIRTFHIDSVHHPREPETFSPKYTFAGYIGDNIKWHECPFDSWQEAEEWRLASAGEAAGTSLKFTEIATEFSEGKAPELEAARTAAIWPDATLEQLQDKSALEARLLALLAEFQRDVESLGLVY